jgi:hypothetical protein
MEETKVIKFEIINHGYTHSQYFQGCGVSFTSFEHVQTGVGMNAKEAYEDAVEQIAMNGFNVDRLPKCPRGMGITKENKVPHSIAMHEENEIYWYVSIRYNTITTNFETFPKKVN